MGENVGYIRVSTLDQKTDRQKQSFERLKLDRSYTDKASGKDTKRPQLEACIDFLRDGDTLHVHSIDRLARNLMDLQKIVEDLNKKGVTIQFHKENLIFSPDSSSPMAQLQLQMMGAFAQFERSLIKERQREGIAAAKAKGKHLGRVATLTIEQVEEIIEKVEQGKHKKDLATEYGVSRQTIYKSLARYKKLIEGEKAN
ncbi:recombinase family protein [Desulforhopalus sp. 52FAK]